MLSKLDSDCSALRGHHGPNARQPGHGERGDEGLSESLRRAMVAFETGGARAAYDHALDAEGLADGRSTGS